MKINSTKLEILLCEKVEAKKFQQHNKILGENPINFYKKDPFLFLIIRTNKLLIAAFFRIANFSSSKNF